MHRRHHPITLLQATREAPMLARLAGLAHESGERLRMCQALIPPMLLATLQPGPIEGNAWCLLVSTPSAAAKIRQLLPALQAHLRSQGRDVETIRLKVQNRRY